MPGIFGLGGPQFGLRDAKVAKNLLNGSFDPAVDVPSVQLVSGAIQTVTGNLEGDDEITATHAKAISAQVQLRFGSISLEVLQVLTGKAIVSSGTTPNEVRRIKFDGLNFPYFALAGKAEAVEDVGSDTHLFIPKIKITEGFTVQMQYGQFAIPEVTAMAVRDPDYTAIMEVIEHETAAVVAIPPA